MFSPQIILEEVEYEEMVCDHSWKKINEMTVSWSVAISHRRVEPGMWLWVGSVVFSSILTSPAPSPPPPPRVAWPCWWIVTMDQALKTLQAANVLLTTVSTTRSRGCWINCAEWKWVFFFMFFDLITGLFPSSIVLRATQRVFGLVWLWVRSWPPDWL